MVPTQDVAWHAGNWWVNSHAVGIENEGFANQGFAWYTDELYRSLGAADPLPGRHVRLPLDRAHMIGHDEVPGPVAANQRGMHWDPARTSTGRI